MAEPTLRTLLTTGTRRERARWMLRIVSPWVVEWWLAKRREDALRRTNRAKLIRHAPRESGRYDEAIRFLLQRGLDEYAVRVGSIPERSLDYMAQVVRDRLPIRAPVRALHIGNFVGVSLCHLSWLVRERHPSSIVVSVDPNQPHMGIANPEAHVFALLEHFGLLSTNVIIRGYTMAATAVPESSTQVACEQVLPALQRVCRRGFDLCLVDGNHSEGYLRDEFGALRGLLAASGIVVFDDIKDFSGVANVFRQALGDANVLQLGGDGRVGIVQIHRAEQPAPSPPTPV